MNWELDSIKKYPSHCGKGEYGKIIESADWYRSGE